MEFLRIQLEPTDYLSKDWSGSAGVTEIVTTDTMIEGTPQGTYVSGYIVSSTDEHGNRFSSKDLPEPFRLQGDPKMSERITAIEAADFDELDKLLDEEHAQSQAEEQKALRDWQDEIVADYDRELSEAKKQFAQNYLSSGARNLDEFDARTYDATFGLSDDQRTAVIEDLNTYENLQSRRRAISREMDRAYARNDHRTDRDISNLEFERAGVIRDMKRIDEAYGLTESAQASQTKETHESFHPSDFIDESSRNEDQLANDFGDINEDNIDAFMTELDLLRDDGLVQ
jgi:hypothetical protein